MLLVELIDRPSIASFIARGLVPGPTDHFGTESLTQEPVVLVVVIPRPPLFLAGEWHSGEKWYLQSHRGLAVRAHFLQIRRQLLELRPEILRFLLESLVLGSQLPNGADGDPLDLGDGRYRQDFTSRKSSPVEVVVTVKPVATNNALDRVVLNPDRAQFPNDGISSSMITVLALDEFGYPVSGIPILDSISA